MGKAILLLVVATSMAASAMYVSQEETRLHGEADAADYKSELLARETATSAYNIVVGRVKRDYSGYRSSYTNLDYGRAKYDIGATEEEDGSVTVVAKGRYGDFEYEIIGNIIMSRTSVLDAATITAPISAVVLANDYQISGWNRGIQGSAESVNGLLVSESSTYSAFLADSNVDQIVGKGGTSDVVQGEPSINLLSVRSKITTYAGANRILLEGNHSLSTDDSMGSPGSPKVLLVYGDLDLKNDFVGYGILYVEGDLTMMQSATWHGLVFVSGSESAFSMKQWSAINGALVMDGLDSVPDPPAIDEGDRGLLGGHFDVDVFDEANSTREIYHEHQYDDKYDVTGIDVISAGCKRPGLCWDQVVGSLGLTEIEIRTMNSSSSSGTYDIQVGTTQYTGNSTTPLSLTVDPRDITRFRYNFTSLCSLAPSKPSDSQDDTVGRNGALSIQIFTTGAAAKLVYEVTVYHHVKSSAADACATPPPGVDQTDWISTSGKNYTGDDVLCFSEDDNDDYTDWTQRLGKWGKRGRNGKSKKSSKKSKKTKSQKDAFLGSAAWTETGSCARSNTNDPVDSNGVSFSMMQSASITFNNAVLKALKSIVSELDQYTEMLIARRLIQSTRHKNKLISSVRVRDFSGMDNTTEEQLRLAASSLDGYNQ